jgi:hypothetical protein
MKLDYCGTKKHYRTSNIADALMVINKKFKNAEGEAGGIKGGNECSHSRQKRIEVLPYFLALAFFAGAFFALAFFAGAFFAAAFFAGAFFAFAATTS